MRPTLQLNLGQQLTLTPQLQQAIRLLQLSTIELQQEIQQALESNPLLELANGEMSSDESAMNEPTSTEELLPETASADSVEHVNFEEPEVNFETGQWDVNEQIGSSSSKNSNDNSEYSFLENQADKGDAIHDYLRWQMALTPLSETDQAIALAIIDSIDEDGFLRANFDDIRDSVQLNLSEPLEPDEIEAVLHRIQHFDPVGVGSRNLQECLLLQLSQCDASDVACQHAKKILKEHMELLAARDYSQLRRKAKLSESELRDAINLIQTLHPRPTAHIAEVNPQYVVPDVIVFKQQGQWKVKLNQEILPKLHINQQYAGMIKRADSSADNNFLRGHLQDARWLIKSIESRHETLLRVAQCIVEHQIDFFERGAFAMKPMVLHDVASDLGLHESTISRVTTQKYMHTSQGIFELKYFFSSHVNTANGGECSSTAIRAMIKTLISEELPQKPLSDQKIAEILRNKGIQVARRTVAKYRESLNIAPSNERKCLAE